VIPGADGWWDWTATKANFQAKGYWDGVEANWNTAWSNYWATGPGASFKDLSFMRFDISWFMGAPQESLATQANHHWANGPGRLIGAVDRFRRATTTGLPPLKANINEVVTFIDFLSAGMNRVNLVETKNPTGSQVNWTNHYADLERDDRGYITRISVDNLIYQLEVNDRGVVTNVTTPPVFKLDNVTKPQAASGTSYSGALAADVTDLDDDTLSFEKLSGPAWLNVSSTGALSGTPATGDIGPNVFVVRVADAHGGSDIALVTIQVYPPNTYGTLSGTSTGEYVNRVQLGGIDNTSGNNSGYADFRTLIAQLTPGQTVSYTLTPGFVSTTRSEAWTIWIDLNRDGDFTDTGEAVLQLTSSTAARTGNITIPATASVGPSRMRIAMKRASAQTSPTGTFTYGEVEDYSVQIGTSPVANAAPYFLSDPLGKPNLAQGSAITGSLSLDAADWENQTLAFSKVSGPAWLQVATNGTLSGTPANGDVGANSFSLRVTDPLGASDDTTLILSVANVNDAPTFASNPIVLSATADTAFTGQLTATDMDGGDTLTYSKVSGPAWLTVSSTGVLGGTPLLANVGANGFSVRVTDAAGLSATAALNITVAAANPDANGNGILDAWEIANFGNANAGSNPATEDPDGDGISNLMEYALDTNPLLANVSSIAHDQEPWEDNQYLRLTVPKNPAATNLTYSVETCGDLVGWTSANTVIETNTAAELVARDDMSTTSAPRRFIRLRVSVIH